MNLSFAEGVVDYAVTVRDINARTQSANQCATAVLLFQSRFMKCSVDSVFPFVVFISKMVHAF